ncbi:CD1375 family protein [Vagococcus salmoninarum]|nr:CD1375 family protein [Vagococcus salmoninarum]MBE9390325.1 ASCH domain-containing protein [Vagococcus salmoninarum]
MIGSYIAKMYANSVAVGDRTIDQVPERFKAEVEQLLKEKPGNKK